MTTQIKVTWSKVVVRDLNGSVSDYYIAMDAHANQGLTTVLSQIPESQITDAVIDSLSLSLAP